MWQGTGGKQICQLKPNSYAFNGKGSASDAAVELMIAVASSYVAGTTEFANLLKFRDSLLEKYGFEQIGALKRPAAAPRLAAARRPATAPRLASAVVAEPSTAMPSIAKRPSGEVSRIASPQVAAQPPPAVTMRSLGVMGFNDRFLSILKDRAPTEEQPVK